MHIISPVTDNCPTWVSARERMAIEMISWPISTKECCRTEGSNPRPHENSSYMHPTELQPGPFSDISISSSIPSWQVLTAHAQPFRGTRDLAFCLKVPLDSLLVWASSGGSGETARMRRLAWTFAARIGDKYQIRLTRSIYVCLFQTNAAILFNYFASITLII